MEARADGYRADGPRQNYERRAAREHDRARRPRRLAWAGVCVQALVVVGLIAERAAASQVREACGARAGRVHAPPGFLHSRAS